VSLCSLYHPDRTSIMSLAAYSSSQGYGGWLLCAGGILNSCDSGFYNLAGVPPCMTLQLLPVHL
jgi:hypothetical protein